LPPGELPIQANAAVFNAETAFRLWEALATGKPMIDKDLTVAGKLKDNGSVRVLRDVPVGMSVMDVLEMAGGLGGEYGELLMGGPFTGRRVTEADAIRKTTGGLIATECFPREEGKIGLLVCACGADEGRLREIAGSMGGRVCAAESCKQATRRGDALKCENPGHCPGQVEKILKLKRAGADAVLIGNCTDCTNTVMSCAPRLGLRVYHSTDQALRAVNRRLIRSFRDKLEPEQTAERSNKSCL
jgi:proline reductase-associated electron transfer protein PrdC